MQHTNYLFGSVIHVGMWSCYFTHFVGPSINTCVWLNSLACSLFYFRETSPDVWSAHMYGKGLATDTDMYMCTNFQIKGGAVHADLCFTHTCVHTHMYSHMYTYTHTHLHTHTHTHVHTHMSIMKWKLKSKHNCLLCISIYTMIETKKLHEPG